MDVYLYKKGLNFPEWAMSWNSKLSFFLQMEECPCIHWKIKLFSLPISQTASIAISYSLHLYWKDMHGKKEAT